MFCEQSSITQESAGRVAIQSLTVDHKHVLLISNSCSCFFLRTLHILPCCKLVHSIISTLSILYVLSNLLVLSFNPLSCPASCHSPNIFTPQYHARVRNCSISILTKSFASLNHENQESNSTTQPVEHGWKCKMVPVNLLCGRGKRKRVGFKVCEGSKSSLSS